MLEWVKGQDSGRSFEHRIRLAGLEKERQQKVLVSQSCLIPCDPMNCNPLGSSVHGILQARIVEWVAIPSSRGSS